MSDDPRYSPITSADGWFAGEDKTLRWTIYDRDPLTETSPPVVQNITGYTLQFKMAATEAGVAVLTKVVTVVSGPAGTCNYVSAAADTTGIAGGTYHYTVSRTDSGQNRVLAYGPVVLHGRPS